jgi:hypothetical protein
LTDRRHFFDKTLCEGIRLGEREGFLKVFMSTVHARLRRGVIKGNLGYRANNLPRRNFGEGGNLDEIEKAFPSAAFPGSFRAAANKPAGEKKIPWHLKNCY